jgi:hypothetical protein
MSERFINDFAALTDKEKSGFSHIEKSEIPYHGILEWIETHSSLNQTQVLCAFFETAKMVVPQSSADLDLTTTFQTYLEDVKRKGVDANPQNTIQNNGFSMGRSVRENVAHDYYSTAIGSCLSYTRETTYINLSGTIFDDYLISMAEKIRNAPSGTIQVKDLDVHCQMC